MSESLLRITGDGIDVVLAPGDAATLDVRGGVQPQRRGAVSTIRAGTAIGQIHDRHGCWVVDGVSFGSIFVAGSPLHRLLLAAAVELRLADPTAGPRLLLTPFARATAGVGALPPPQPRVDAAASDPAVLVVRGLTVAPDQKPRLDGVDLTVRVGEFVAVLGASGAGKSTLVRAITGTGPATSGTITLNGFDLYESFDRSRTHIGYVPQDDILHPQLTVWDTLVLAARLRFAAGTPLETIETRVGRVLIDLGLESRQMARVDQLSGGERKRVNVAVELLTSPTLLILDEPTSGLDPGNERLLMELFRGLASGGRMVIVVTHNVESLHLCDQVLLLARGGVPVYAGPADGLTRHVGARSLAEVFSVIEDLDDLSAARLPRSLPSPSAARQTEQTRLSLADQFRQADWDEVRRQFWILSERYVKVLVSDRRNLTILALQAPLIAALMLGVFGVGLLRVETGPHPKAGNVLMALVLATIYLGTSNAVREIVKEGPILRREQNFGLSITAYISSKVLVLGVITVAQTSVLMFVGTARQNGPNDAVSFLPADLELLIVLAVCGVSAMCLGLMISAVVSSADKALTLLPVTLFAQFLLAGLIFPVTAPIVQQLSWLTQARWGFAGAASVSDFSSLGGCSRPSANSSGPTCSTLWEHEIAPLLLSVTMLCLLGVGALAVAWRTITNRDPAATLRHARGAT